MEKYSTDPMKREYRENNREKEALITTQSEYEFYVSIIFFLDETIIQQQQQQQKYTCHEIFAPVKIGKIIRITLKYPTFVIKVVDITVYGMQNPGTDG